MTLELPTTWNPHMIVVSAPKVIPRCIVAPDYCMGVYQALDLANFRVIDGALEIFVEALVGRISRSCLVALVLPNRI